MKILYLEDSGSAMYLADYIKDTFKHDVWCTSDFRDVMSWLEFDPGADQFGAIMFDLVISDETLLPINPAEPFDADRHKLPSLYFIQHYIKKHFSQLESKIILCSAYFDTVDEYPSEILEEIKNYHRLDKRSPHVIEELTRLLLQMEA